MPSTKVDPFPDFDNFAWRAFIALNWPSLTDPLIAASPIAPRRLAIPDPRVWETFKARYELFQVGPTAARRASAMGDLRSAEPLRTGRRQPPKTLATFDPFHGFQPGQLSSRRGRQSARRAESHLYALRSAHQRTRVLGACVSGWSQGENLPDAGPSRRIARRLIAVKAAWRLLTAADTPAVRARYYVVENAEVVDVAKTLAARRVVCSKNDVALVGLHIVIKTKYRPQGLWSTFEHVDNVPPVGVGEAREPDAKDAGAPYSFFDARSRTLGLWPTFGTTDTLPVSLEIRPRLSPTPMQVVRRHPIHPSTMAMNRAYWALPEIKGTVWEHYMLVASQWPTVTRPVHPQNDGAYFPGLTLPPNTPRENYQAMDAPKENLANTTIETYFQDPPSSCMACHQSLSNALGRDFVGMLASFR